MSVPATTLPAIRPYPLFWPSGWPRTPNRFPARLRVSFRVVREALLETLYRLDADDPLISCNLPLDHLTFSSVRLERPDDPGVAVYFHLLGGHWVMPCDQWDSVRANIQGINQTLLAMETLAHAGVNDALYRALQGFAVHLEPRSTPRPPVAVPPASPEKPLKASTDPQAWLRLLGLKPDFSREQLEEAYWYLRHAYHPDRGGDEEIFQGLREARRQAMLHLRERDSE